MKRPTNVGRRSEGTGHPGVGPAGAELLEIVGVRGHERPLISAGRREVVEVVEHAGKPFRAAAVRTAVRWFGDREGDALVGSTEILWRYVHPDAVAVSHAGPIGLLAALMGVAAEPQSYSLRVLRDATPSGGSRWWWECPGCGRRCGLLYLVTGRPRLACRTCLGLTYLSQTLPRKRRGARR